MAETSTVVIVTRFGPQPMDTIWEQDGLAVHRDFWGDPEGEPGAPEGWTVTHVRSGFAVRIELDRQEALDLAEALVELDVDWTRDYAATVGDDALYAAVRKLAAKTGWRLAPKKVADARRKRALAEFVS